MLQPYEWKDNPAFIEHVFPVQKISAESFKEQEARQMGIIISIVIVLFLLGSWLLVLRSANNHKLPPNVKSKPYLDEED